MTDPATYGIMAEFETAEELLDAARALGGCRYTRVETYTPMPVHGLAEIIGVHRHRVARIVLAGGFLAASAAMRCSTT